MPLIKALNSPVEALTSVRRSFIGPPRSTQQSYLTTAPTPSSSISMPHNVVFFCPVFFPTVLGITATMARTSSSSTFWGQTSNPVNYSVEVNLLKADPKTGLPSGNLLLPVNIFSLPTSFGVNTSFIVSFSVTPGPVLPSGLHWLIVSNNGISGATLPDLQLAGVAPSSGDRDTIETVLFRKLIGSSATGSLSPYSMAILNSSGGLSAVPAMLGSLTLQYNTSSANSTNYRLRANAPYIGLAVNRVL